jgi:nucleotide-binding universal stress UspA family protein
MEESGTSQRIVVGVDGSEQSRRALRWAIEESKLKHALLAIVTAWHVPLAVHGLGSAAGPPAGLSLDELVQQAAESVSSSAAREAREAGAANVEVVVNEGHASDVLISMSEGAGLLVVGSHDHGGMPSIHLGSVSLQCAQNAHCATVVVR